MPNSAACFTALIRVAASVRQPARRAAKPVDDPAVGDGDQPRPERPVGIVGLPYGVDSHQNVLDRILHFGGPAQIPDR